MYDEKQEKDLTLNEHKQWGTLNKNSPVDSKSGGQQNQLNTI